MTKTLASQNICLFQFWVQHDGRIYTFEFVTLIRDFCADLVGQRQNVGLLRLLVPKLRSFLVQKKYARFGPLNATRYTVYTVDLGSGIDLDFRSCC